MENQKIRTQLRWEKSPKLLNKEALKAEEIIPVEPSNQSYTLVHSVVLAIKKMMNIKRTIDHNISYLDRLSTDCHYLDAVSGELGGAMMRMAKLGYGLSRCVAEFQKKDLNYFIDIYRADKRDIFEFPKKSIPELMDAFRAASCLIDRVLGEYKDSARVQSSVIDELRAVAAQLRRCENLLNFVL